MDPSPPLPLHVAPADADDRRWLAVPVLVVLAAVLAVDLVLVWVAALAVTRADAPGGIVPALANVAGFVLYGAALLAVARTGTRRLLAPAFVLLSILTHAVAGASGVAGIPSALFLVAAWGVARQRGRLWPIGLAVTLVGSLLTTVLADRYYETAASLLTPLGDGPATVVTFATAAWVWWVLPVLAGGVACREVEILVSRRA